MSEYIVAMGIPSALFGLIISIFLYLFKRSIDKRDKEREEMAIRKELEKEEREKNIEKMMIMIMQTSRATSVLAEATARAVQRIPDAKCNGDMDSALVAAQKIQNEEKQFLMDQGIKHIFG